MRIFLALCAAVFSSAGWAADQPAAQSEEQQPRQVELKWQAVKTSEPNMKQRTIEKMQNRQRVSPKLEPLRRYQNEQGEWVIGHGEKAAKAELKP